MPRLKRPHRYEIIDLPCDPSVPLDLRRALYTRLSDDDDEKISHTSQQNEIQAAFGLRQQLPLPAEANAPTNGVAYLGHDRGYVVTQIIRDWRTGADPKRLGLNRGLIKGAHEGKHAGVLFRDDDRLFRDVIGGLPLVQLNADLPSYRFEVAIGSFDIEEFATHAAWSGRERRKTRYRTMNGRRNRAMAGRAVHGKFPYWLTRDPIGGGAKLIPERADAMRMAIALYAGGMRMGLVTKWLIEHAPPGGESDTWTSDRFREALRSPALWGRWDYGRHKIITERRGDEVFVVGREINPNAIKFEAPPLVHRTELDRAACDGCPMDTLPSADKLDELIRSSNRRTGGRPANRSHPLRKRVVCACGWRMAYQPKILDGGREQDYGYLSCARTKQRGTSVATDYPPCPTRRTRVLWPQVRDLLIDAIHHPDQVIAQVEADILAAAASEARTAAEDDATLERATEKLRDLDEQENRLYVRWDIEKKISEVVYQHQSARIAGERAVQQELMRQVLDRRRILETASVATASLREGLAEAVDLPLESERMTLEHWTGLVERLVQDVVLDASGMPTLRWRQA